MTQNKKKKKTSRKRTARDKVFAWIDEWHNKTRHVKIDQDNYPSVIVWAKDWEGRDDLMDIREKVTSERDKVQGSVIRVDFEKEEVEISHEVFEESGQKRGVTTIPWANIIKVKKI